MFEFQQRTNPGHRTVSSIGCLHSTRGSGVGRSVRIGVGLGVGIWVGRGAGL